MTDHDDVKRLLGRAFWAEPPLRLDRDEVLARGRARVRNRRIAAASAVAASVVAVVVGAAALSGLGAGAPGGDVTPAYGGTAPGVPSITEAVPSAPVTHAPSDAHAAALSGTLVRMKVIPGEFVPIAVIDDGRAPLEFRRYPDGYLLVVDLRDGKGQGNLELKITYWGAGAALPACGSDLKLEASCEVSTRSGVSMRLSTERYSPGHQAFVVWALKPDGTVISARSSNTAKRFGVDAPVTRPAPPLDAKALAGIATLPGLSYR